ncbi:transcriptional repressor [Candidatus Falkowbacteria bacterium]|uniref:Transcriptional repressor n=1 Tax=Candidatus Falkowbacteria bacterium CG10_big_fil_rev_8_21_14_0_10_37_18 TaxID=1974562 RepID=A0A2H0V9K7_9BACT|nr:transcriptional repressor [Candidatus Falkowbacteria bacterium]NCQ12855.1 transcriptional repressor [Candidatus Falkowbacteria bacterium]PIR95787.1 MAG: hypothetical protein COT93_00635 [Candidatus Falkowbacteria bacterium CG10_big_fil_rev_8_21_14_0_10_37_18]
MTHKIKNSNHFLNSKLADCRQTKTRRGVLLVLKNSQPLAAPEILDILKENNIVVNKTTVYRELDFLLNKKVIAEVILKDGLKRYELQVPEHGHHLICLQCQKIERVALDNDLDKQEKAITRSRGFKVLNHSLEFYGLCRHCVKK